MKNRWICLLVALFMFTALPVSAEGNPPPVTLSVEELTVNPGTDIVEVSFYYDTTEYLLDGNFLITFPADKLQLLIEGTSDTTNQADEYIFLPFYAFNATKASEGRFVIAFICPNYEIEPGSGCIAKLPFKILDPAVGGDYKISIAAMRLVKWVDGIAAGQNMVSDETPIEASGTMHVIPDPNATHTTTVITTPYDPHTTTYSPYTTTMPPVEITSLTHHGATIATEQPTNTSTTTTTTTEPTTTTTTTTEPVTTTTASATSRATTTTTEPVASSEIATTTALPTTQPANATEAVTETTETESFPWWIVLLVAAVAGLAVLIPLTVKLRKR